MSQDQETKIVTDESVPPPEHHEAGLNDNDTFLDDRGRRTFLKRAALGGGGALLAGAGSYAFVKSELKGKPVTDYPMIDEAIFKPKDQRDTILTFIHNEALGKKHPERNIQYNKLQNKV